LDEFIAKEGIDYSHFDFDQEHNPLAQLYLARQYETAWLFGSSNDNQYPLVEAKDARGEKLRDPVATKPLAFWRNTVRTGAAYHYAFAVPTNQALDIILSLNTQVIDIGAGTGYWAYQLQRRSRGEHQILAYDSVPCGTGRTNAYHGNAPSWFQVQRLEASQVPIPGTGATILVVYPPPDPDEAFLAGLVHRFAQSTIDQNSTNRLVLVSEWRGGDTASPACRTALLAKLTLEAHHPTTIPNWGDTSASLTIWKLGATQFPCPLDKCTACETYNAPALFRCRLSCDFQVCSQECAHAAVETYKAAVAAKCFKHIVPPSPPDITNTRFFRRIPIFTSMHRQDNGSVKAHIVTKRATLLRKKKKKQRKKERRKIEQQQEEIVLDDEEDEKSNLL